MQLRSVLLHRRLFLFRNVPLCCVLCSNCVATNSCLTGSGGGVNLRWSGDPQAQFKVICFHVTRMRPFKSNAHFVPRTTRASHTKARTGMQNTRDHACNSLRAMHPFSFYVMTSARSESKKKGRVRRKLCFDFVKPRSAASSALNVLPPTPASRGQGGRET